MNIEEIKTKCERAKREEFPERVYDSAAYYLITSDIPALIAKVERLTEENESLAVNGGKYMEIAQKRYEMFEKASKRAENAEITNTAKDQQIATLKAAKDEINRYNIDCTKQCDKLLVENATLKKALELACKDHADGCTWHPESVTVESLMEYYVRESQPQRAQEQEGKK